MREAFRARIHVEPLTPGKADQQRGRRQTSGAADELGGDGVGPEPSGDSGHQRQGNFSYLQQNSERFGFRVDETETLMHDGERISSTRVRECIQQDNFARAAELLGRPYSLSGRIAHGRKLGRQLGYPTINIKMGDKTLIVKGIFAVQVKGIDNHPLRGVASIGTRPTVNGVDTILEVYILDFNRDVYGYRVEVEFLHKIRNEEKFDSLKELSAHIAQDTTKAKAFFARIE